MTQAVRVSWLEVVFVSQQAYEAMSMFPEMSTSTGGLTHQGIRHRYFLQSYQQLQEQAASLVEELETNGDFAIGVIERESSDPELAALEGQAFMDRVINGEMVVASSIGWINLETVRESITSGQN